MTEYKKAIDAFMISDEGIRASDPATISAPLKNRVYLENRLREAFRAGWLAHEAATGIKPQDQR